MEFLNVAGIAEFAVRVGEISLELLHPKGITLEEVYEGPKNQAHFSRTFLRALTE